MLVGLAVASGCHKNPNYCPGANPNDNCAEIDAAGSDAGCLTSDQCAASAMPVCNTATMTCVQCTASEAEACTGTTPVCGTDNTCRGCASHDECTSAVCLPDGSCSDGSNVAYVNAAGTDNAMCTKAMPCIKLSSALATARPYVKLTGTTNEQVSIDNQNVTLLADPGAKLTSTSNGIVLEIKGSSQVAIDGLEITGASGATGYGISLPTGNTAKLTLQRSRVTNNAAGGISVSGGDFDITNTIVAGNGTSNSSFGGVRFDSTNTGTRRFEFNTITNNSVGMGLTGGVVCTLVGQAVTFANNIVFNNQIGSGRTQVSGSNCNWTYSDIGPDTVSGTGNINMDPMFANAAQGDFHITAASPCKDAADPSATLAVDIDGDSRPQGSGRDIGADEQQ